MSMQDRILGTIEKMTRGQQLDFVQNPFAANTGVVYIQAKGQFSTIIAFHYYFQTTVMELVFYPPGHEPVGGNAAPGDWIYLRYDQDKEIQALMAKVGQWLHRPDVHKPKLRPRHLIP